MRIKTTCLFLIILISRTLWSQGTTRITGPLSVYDMVPGYCYSDSSGTDSVTIQSVIRFGELGINNGHSYFHSSFQTRLDSAMAWHPNKIFGIVLPPSEDGVYNQPWDTSLYFTVMQKEDSPSGPGMIQGAERFSRLSQLYGGISGVILDDWNGDTAITRQIRDAVQGRYVDPAGNVCSECIATTPYNKVIAVLYNTYAIPAAMPVIDGLFYSLFRTQECCDTDIDMDIDQLQASFPGKEINIAIFLDNSVLGWTDPSGVSYMLRHLLDRYDTGDINGVNIFAEIFLSKNFMSVGRWDSLALPFWLDSLYYPYLGAGQGTVYDCNGNPLTGANVHVFCQSRSTGDTLSRSNQKGDAEGGYQVGLWAGNRNTDSTYYWLIAEKTGYTDDTVGFWIKRGATTIIPDAHLCPVTVSDETDLILYPNPTPNWCSIVFNTEKTVSGTVNVYDQLGRLVTQVMPVNGYAQINMSGWAAGIYIVRMGSYIRKVVKE